MACETCATCGLPLPAFVEPYAPRKGCDCTSWMACCPGAAEMDPPESWMPLELSEVYKAHACLDPRPVCLCASAVCIT
jgi:hypothetical protein